MEPIEFSRMEKALVVAACFPFLMMGVLFLFA
jgi:cell division protein FtsL